MDETLFGYIHLSDIHFGHGDATHGWNQKLVLAQLCQDIAARPAKVRVDAILVTGDLAFSGNGRSPNEYADADKWLRDVAAAAGVEAGRIFLVPGNHDVKRDVDKRSDVGPLVDNLRAGRVSIDDVLADPKLSELLAARMDDYLDLSARFAPACLAIPAPAIDRLSWVHTLTGRSGLKVRLAGLNTALLCKDDTDPSKLQLGQGQLVMALQPNAAPGELIMVLTHHPLRAGWLADEKNADRWLKNHAHVHLSGHVHEAESEDARSGQGGRFVRVSAGAAHGERLPEAWLHASHGYSFGEVRRGNGDKLVLRVYPRLWSEPNTTFVLDVHGVLKDKSYGEHELGVTLPAPGEVAPPSRTPPVVTTVASPPAPGSPALVIPAPMPPAVLSQPPTGSTRRTRGVVAACAFLGVALLGAYQCSDRRTATAPVASAPSANATHQCDKAFVNFLDCETQCFRGHAGSCNNLGVMYETGNGVQDHRRAAALYEQACDAGFAIGCQNLGFMYDNGNGVAQDHPRAFHLYEQACDGGDPQGCNNVGVMYANGKGVPQDNALAAQFYKQACDEGLAIDCHYLGRLCETGAGVARDDPRAAQLYEQACAGGIATSCHNLGFMYATGRGVPQDVAHAVRLYRKACDGGAAIACNNLGVMYANGAGVAQDGARAAQLYERACDGGDANGCNNLGAVEH